MRLSPSGLAPLSALLLAALACNLPGVGQSTAPSAEAEMSLAEALTVPAEDARPETLRLMGLPDALKPCSLEEIIATANKSEPLLRKLIEAVVERVKL